MVLLAAALVVVAMASGARPKRRLHHSRVQVQNQEFEAPVRVASYQLLRSKLEGRRHTVAGAVPQCPSATLQKGALLSEFGRKWRAVSLRYKIEPGDVEGHRYKTWEDMQGQVTVRVNDGTEVQGHISRIRFESVTGSDTKGQARRIRFEPMDPSGEDTGCQGKRIELKVGDAQAKLLRAATDRGESVYVRFSDEDDVRGHLYRVKF
jgi:hypothetical protein